VTQWLSASLDLQILNPVIKKTVSSGGGGVKDIDTGIVVGARMYVRF